MESTKKSTEGVKGYIWFVGFRNTTRPLPLPWKWICRDGYKHVYAMRYDPNMDCWILCEWLGFRLHIELLRGEKVEALFHQASQSGGMVSYESEYRDGLAFNFRMPIYCVTWAKHLLGLQLCPAVTPYQLFCALRNRGGSVMFEQEKRNGFFWKR